MHTGALSTTACPKPVICNNDAHLRIFAISFKDFFFSFVPLYHGRAQREPCVYRVIFGALRSSFSYICVPFISSFFFLLLRILYCGSAAKKASERMMGT